MFNVRECYIILQTCLNRCRKNRKFKDQKVICVLAETNLQYLQTILSVAMIAILAALNF